MKTKDYIINHVESVHDGLAEYVGQIVEVATTGGTVTGVLVRDEDTYCLDYKGSETAFNALDVSSLVRGLVPSITLREVTEVEVE